MVDQFEISWEGEDLSFVEEQSQIGDQIAKNSDVESDS